MIHLRTLGGLDLRDSDGRELRTVLAQPKRAALLVYLALARPGNSHRRDTLLALFWPEQDAEHARNALSQALHFLRRWLGPEAVSGANGDGLRVQGSQVSTDVAAFEEALEAGRISEAVELYRGEFLEGFHIADAPEFERWLDSERARLAGAFEKAVEATAQERQDAGDWTGAVREWRRLAVRNPYDSRVALRLIRAYAATGDPAAAVQHARVHELLLREELNVAPDPEIGALIKQLQVRGPDPATPPAVELRSIAKAPAAPKALQPDKVVPSKRIGRLAAGVLALVASGAVAFALKMGAHEPSRPPMRSLAVLPLENLSGDSGEQFFADGLHDALITELARYPELRVISRTSVMQYRDTRKRLPDIARELKVDGIVEGTLMRDGGQVRMNAQLVHGPTDRHLWAQRYERSVRDVLLLQAELAQAIAREVNAAATPVGATLRAPAGAADMGPSALYLKELYLRGRHAEISRTPIGIQTAKQYYHRAIERDSSFALGYAGLAGVYSIMADYDFAPVGPSLDTARFMASRAVALDSTLSETRTALGLTLGDVGQFARAEREILRAIELAPSNARAHYSYSLLLVALGRGQEALREANRAAELDPFGPRAQLGMKRYATWLVTGERPHLKLPVAERRMILKVEPGEPWALAQDAYEYAAEGQCSRADRSIDEAIRLAPESRRMLAYVATVYWYCGRQSQARAVVNRMKSRPDARDHGFRVALVYTAMGEADSAFAWLQHQRWTLGQLSGLSADRRLDPLRSDPRYPELLRRLGIR